VALAEQELNNQFKTHGLNEVSYLPGYIANVYSGSLTWSSSDTPSNHSPFSFAEVEPIRAAKQKTPHLTLQEETRQTVFFGPPSHFFFVRK
jgi:hypothetical protein